MVSKFGVLTLAAALVAPAVTMAAVRKEEPKKIEAKESKKTEAAEEKSSKQKNVANDQAALQKEAKISMERAREIALKKVPGGKIESGELEREHGKLIYSFDIRNPKGSITEVNVNAVTGKIVAVHLENAKKEAAEKKQEAKEKKTAKQ